MTDPNAVRRGYLRRAYGITLEEYDDLLRDQGGVCAICLRPPKTIRLSLDHLHVRGYKKMKPEKKRTYIRGVICFSCNASVMKTLDAFGSRMERAIEYRDKPRPFA